MNRLITVRYFAALREQRGLDREKVATPASTPGELYLELAKAHRLKLDVAVVRAASGDQFIPMDASIGEVEEIVFLPPMAGG